MKDEHSIVKEPPIAYDGSYTYSDYMKFDFEYMVELIRGKIFKMSHAPSIKHQQAVGKLYVKFMNYTPF